MRRLTANRRSRQIATKPGSRVKIFEESEGGKHSKDFFDRYGRQPGIPSRGASLWSNTYVHSTSEYPFRPVMCVSTVPPCRDPLVGQNRLGIPAAGGSPAAGHFPCAAKESNQRKAAPGVAPRIHRVSLCCLTRQGGCGTRPGEAHKSCLTAGLEQVLAENPLSSRAARRATRGSKQRQQKQNKKQKQLA